MAQRQAIAFKEDRLLLRRNFPRIPDNQQNEKNRVIIVNRSTSRVPDWGRNKSKVTSWQLNCVVILWPVVNVTNNILSLVVHIPQA